MSILCRLSPRHLTSPFLIFLTKCLATYSGTAAAVSRDTTPWIPAPLSEIKPIAESLYHVSIDVSDSPDLAASYTFPGQYLQLRVPVVDRQTFMAIASPPSFAASRGAFEFLVKSVPGSTAELLSRLKRGDVLELSHAIGKGFEFNRIDPPEKCQAVLIFATGSGISPIRSLIESGFNADRRSDVRLYYGARTLREWRTRIGSKIGNRRALRLSQYYHNQIIVGEVKLVMYRLHMLGQQRYPTLEVQALCFVGKDRWQRK